MFKKILSDFLKEIKKTIYSFKPIYQIGLLLLFIIGTISLGTYAWQKSITFAKEVPAEGGHISEGVVGQARFINPILATSETDKQLTTLIYSGLMRRDDNGRLILDMAREYKVSEDNKRYSFWLKPDLYWHDGEEITSEDIVFTINSLKDAVIKSPRAVNWQGIEVEAPNDRQIIFTLEEEFPDFLDLTTLGILPSHLWQKININEFAFDNLNLEPIGSGPYKFSKIKTNNEGTIYELKSFNDFILGEAKIERVDIHLYNDRDLMINDFLGEHIDNLYGIDPSLAREIELEGKHLTTAPLPRVFGIFLNQNNEDAFIEEEVREALNISINKKELIEQNLAGYATILNGPISPRVNGYEAIKEENIDNESRITQAINILTEAGWTKNDNGILEKDGSELTISISTADAPELTIIAESVAKTWRALGVKTNIQSLEQTKLQQEVIRPRNYEALLFGMVVGENSDLFSFWHSSQRFDPGLNIAMYADIKTDELLEELRETTDKDKRRELTREIQLTVAENKPAIFLYSPYFLYFTDPEIKNINIGHINNPADRFNSIYKWYIETDRIWKIFSTNN